MLNVFSSGSSTRLGFREKKPCPQFRNSSPSEVWNSGHTKKWHTLSFSSSCKDGGKGKWNHYFSDILYKQPTVNNSLLLTINIWQRKNWKGMSKCFSFITWYQFPPLASSLSQWSFYTVKGKPGNPRLIKVSAGHQKARTECLVMETTKMRSCIRKETN